MTPEQRDRKNASLRRTKARARGRYVPFQKSGRPAPAPRYPVCGEIIDEPGIVKWKAVQGSTFYKQFTLTQNGAPVNITGWTAKLGGKRNINQNALDIDLSTTGGTITIGGVTGVFTITAAPATTRTWPIGDVIIQFEFIEGAVVQTYFIGTITVVKEIPV